MWFKPWLNSKEREELIALREEKIKNEQEKWWQKATEIIKIGENPYAKPIKSYSKLFLVNDILTIVFNDGNVISKTGVGVDVVENIKNALSEKEIISLLSYKEPVKNDSPIEKKDLSILDDRFVVEGERVFLKGVGLQIPNVIVENFIEILEKLLDERLDLESGEKLEDRFNRLKFFWLKLATSPNAKIREQVLTYCKTNDLKISKRGNIIAYRRVNKWNNVDDTKLNEFVDAEYTKVKTVWKKKAIDFEVWKNTNEKHSYIIVNDPAKLAINGREEFTWEFVGNLAELKANGCAEKVQLYTSQHNAGKYTFAIGDVYEADEDDIDLDASICHSGGLHFASVDYNYSGYGNVGVCVLINPSKAITIPLGELRKGRTVEMKIACLNPNPIGVHIDEELIECADEAYNEYTLEQLEEALKNRDFSELCIQEKIPVINLADLTSITEQLKQRVVVI